MKKITESIVLYLMMLCVAVGMPSCGSDEPDGKSEGGEENPIDFTTTLPGTWFKVKDVVKHSESGEGQADETITYNAYSYTFIKIILADDQESLQIQRLSYPSLNVIDTYSFKLDGDKILKDGAVAGTIVENNSKSGTTGLVILWEPDVEPFNAVYDCRVESSYYRWTAS